MSAFAASSWAAIVAVAHQLEREAVGLDPPVAHTLRGFARRLHTARLLGRRLFLAAQPPQPPASTARETSQEEEVCG